MHPTSSGEGFSAYVLAILVVFSFFSSMFIEHLTSDISSQTVFAFVAVVSSQKVPVGFRPPGSNNEKKGACKGLGRAVVESGQACCSRSQTINIYLCIASGQVGDSAGLAP